MANVEISGVRKSYGALEVVHGVDIDIKDGEFVTRKDKTIVLAGRRGVENRHY